MNIGNGLIEQMDIIYQKKVRQSDNCAHESVPTSFLQELPYSVSIYLTIVF